MCISNGFDGENFKEIENFKKYEKFTISYIGTFILEGLQSPFLGQLSVKKDGLIKDGDIRLNTFGNTQYINGNKNSMNG